VTGLDRYHQSEWYGSIYEAEPAGWRRFYATDSRFPVSFAYPPGSTPWLDRSRTSWIKVEIGNDAVLDREDLRSVAAEGDAEAAMVIVRPSLGPTRLIGQLRRQHDRQVFLGMRSSAADSGFEVRRRGELAGTDESVAVFEVSPIAQPEEFTIGFVAGEGLWALAKRRGSAMSPDVLSQIGDSVRWSGMVERRRLELQQAARAFIHGAGGNPADVLRQRLARRLGGLRAQAGRRSTFLGVEVSFDPADLPQKPASWPTSGHFQVGRADAEPLLFGSEALAAAQIIDEAYRHHANGWTVDEALVEAVLL